MLTRDLHTLHHETLPRLVEELKLAGERHRDASVEEYGRILEKTLKEGIIHTFNAWVTREEERLNAEYARISHQFSARTNAIIDDILATSAKLFELPLERVQTTETLNEESRLYYLIGDQIRFFDLEGVFDFMARHLVPKRLSQQWILRKLLDKLAHTIDGNCGRVRSDFAYRLQQSFLKFRWNLNETIAATIESVQHALRKALAMKNVRSAEAAELTARLQAQAEEAARLEQAFQRLADALQALSA